MSYNNIFIRMKNQIIILIIAIFCISLIQSKVLAQGSATTKGVVVDEKKLPVYGALVQIKGDPMRVAVTDKDGNFTIDVLPGESLEIRSSDRRIKTIVADGSPEMSVVMDYLSQEADMGFNIRQAIEETTATISRTNHEEIDRRSSLNLGNALFGNSLGLITMQRTGTVWENSPSMIVRGLQTSNNNPLILIDGFERPINEVTVEEVESISILRDAAAIALYGYFGVNGVVSIRTKRGTFNGREIKVNYDHAFNFAYNLPKFANSYRYASALNEALRNDGRTERYTRDELEAFRSGEYPYLYPNVDWVNETVKDQGFSNIYNISFRGGTTRMRYYTMVDLQSNIGYIKNADKAPDYSSQLKHSKLNVRSNVDISLSNSTDLSINLLGILSEHNRPGRHHNQLFSDLYLLPSAAYPVQTYDGIWGGSVTWPTTNPVAGAIGTGSAKGHARALYADAKIIQKLDFLTKGLNTSLQIGYDNKADYWEDRSMQYEYANDAVTLLNGIPVDTVRTTGGMLEEPGFSSSLGYMWRYFNLVGTIDYEKTVKDHSLYTAFNYAYKHRSLQGQNNTTFMQDFSLYTHYGWKQKYFADMALVLSGTNRLAPSQRYSFSPTLSLAWIISKEDFINELSFVDFFKLRASAGMLHSPIAPSHNFWSQTFNSANSYPLGDNFSSPFGGMAEGQLPSSNIKTERANKFELGLDAQLMNDFRLTGDVYYQRRDNILITSSGGVSSIIGITPSYANAGIVDSYGFETGFEYNKQVGDFIFNAGGKYLFNKSKIIEMLEEPKPYSYLEETGRSLGQIFGLEAVGFFVDQADIDHSPIQQFSVVRPGDIKYKDQNGDGLINEFDFVPLGHNQIVPEMYFSFDFGMEWKGLGFDALFQGVSNYSVLLNTVSVYHPLVNNATISDYYYENRWTPDTPFSRFPRLTSEQNINNTQTSTVWLQDASYLKLRHVELYYKLNKNILSLLGMSSGKIYARGVDLFSIDKMDVNDPEGVGVAYPMTKSIHVGFSMGF